MGIKENAKEILAQLPDHVLLVGATKTRSPEEILEAVEGGLSTIGENYAQEAETKACILRKKVQFHFIGHLQRNKVKKIIEFIDMIETVDSVRIAEEINKRSQALSKSMPVLIEINSGREPMKAGVLPDDAESLIGEISAFSNIRVMGLMTMGPLFGDPEDARPYFIETKRIFERIQSLHIPNVAMNCLSMGMSNSYRVAIEEGANIVRIGTKIFGRRS